MFKKLISNLPFNPSLLNQVTFYAKRMRQEESLRRLGFGFVALAMFIQMFAVIAPPEKSLAYSSDYIINGLRTRDDILRAWDGQTGDRDVAAIYSRFGITREDIAALPMQPNVTMNSCYADYWTIGRTSLSAVSKSSQIKQQYKNSEVAVPYGSGNVYLRQLKAWDIINNCNTYRAFEGWKNGKQFWILVDCGNFTQVGPPPILKNPGLELRKTIEGGPRTLKPGESFTFRFEYRNPVAQSVPAQNVMLEDDLDLNKFDVTGFEYPINPGAGIGRFLHPSASTGKTSFLSLPLGNVGYSASYRTAARITVRLKDNLANGTKACNAAKLASSNAADAWSGGSGLCITSYKPEPVEVCDKQTKQIITIEKDKIISGRHVSVDDPACQPPPEMTKVCDKQTGRVITIEKNKVVSGRHVSVDDPACKPCPIDSSIKEADSRCKAPSVVCVITNTTINRTTKEYTLRTEVKSTNEYMTQMLRYEYSFGDNSPVKRKNSAAYTDQEVHVYPDGTYNGTVTAYYNAGRGTARTEQSVACSLAVESEPDQPLTQDKSARNITQGLDEEKTLAAKMKAGDEIEYSLITVNSYSYDRANINVSDHIGDLLEYADLDMAFLASQGGTYDKDTKTINWKPQTVKANSDLTNKFRIKIKDPIPSTNQPSAMTTSFDCHIGNKFGEQVDLEIDCPLPKSAEYVTERLPNTGPGTSLLIGFTATTVIGYFLARSRLLAKELELVRSDFAQTGGI